MPSSRSAHANNPFDSDDETSYSNPFDDNVKHSNPVKSSTASQNPTKSKISSNPGKSSTSFDSKNPFDDDDDFVNQFVKSSKPLRRPSEENNSRNPELTDQKPQRASRNVFKETASASGAAVMRKGQKIRDAGANQAAKLVEGGAGQVQRLRGSTQKAFSGAAGNGRGNSGYDDGQRDELFGKPDPSDSYGNPGATGIRYDDSQFQKQDLEYKSTEDLEGYAVQKAKDTTNTVQNCLRVAEDIKGEATTTLLTLHEQGKQIERAHNVTQDVDQHLGRGEKLLGSLGGMFSRTWKPKKGRPVTGPAMSKNESFKRRGYHLEQRVALGINRTHSKGRNNRPSRTSNAPQTTQEIVDTEKAKQDDALSDLSNVLDELKGMTLDMGKEISSHIEKMDGLEQDVTTLNERVQGANQRARRLLRK